LGTLSKLPGCNPVSSGSARVDPCPEDDPPQMIAEYTVYYQSNAHTGLLGFNLTEATETTSIAPVNIPVGTGTTSLQTNSPPDTTPMSTGQNVGNSPTASVNSKTQGAGGDSVFAADTSQTSSADGSSTITTPQSGTTSPEEASSNTLLIVGVVVGAIILVVLIMVSRRCCCPTPAASGATSDVDSEHEEAKRLLDHRHNTRSAAWGSKI